uniref:SUN domain-containing protein n=1 Tax=Stomoxys calcitrans TaxID=35570 RepID=A0A1I8P4F0_STOCA
MRFNLLLITFSLSYFLFYAAAAAHENTKHTVQEPKSSDAKLATPNATPPTDTPSAKRTIGIGTTNTAKSAKIKTADQENVLKPNENRQDKTVNILPNYKKVKKFLQPVANNAHSSPDPNAARQGRGVNSFNTPSVSTAHKADEDDDDDALSNSNTIVVNDVNDKRDGVEQSDLVLNENVVVLGDNIEGAVNADSNVDILNSLEADESRGGAHHGSKGNNVDETSLPLSGPADKEVASGGVNGIDETADKTKSLPDITDIPTVTIAELPLEILQPSQNSLDPVIIGGEVAESSSHDERAVNRTLDIDVDNEGDIQKDGQIVKINDSGGGSGDGDVPTMPVANLETSEIPPTTSPTSASTNIPNETTSTNITQQHSSQLNDSELEKPNTTITASISSPSPSSSTPAENSSASQVNLTAEEVPMPVFSEWAQKQMEEAEKQALEQEQTFNNSAQRKNNTNGNGKPAALKIRAKNYASPDCGAKIIAASAYTTNAGAVLSASRDEYMLSLCGNRIWFVVELCEAIQAQKIDFANFELYSSSPQNFTVAVSKRFPTREWSNVGRFVANDKRAVQSFDLHPHLFGKFVRVDINSHYSNEHFCTLSLFRVFGTSEFEAFETENHPNEELNDFDDEDLQEQSKNSEPNLFKSASDAVLSIVKKATELVGKPSNNQNQTFKTPQHAIVCRTPMYGLFSCAECSSTLVDRVNNALSCEFRQLNSLLSVPEIRSDIVNTRVCAKLYGIETRQQLLASQKDIKQSFYVNILPHDYVGALCQLLAMPRDEGAIKDRPDISDSDKNEPEEASTNQTLDKKFGKEDLELLHKPETKLIRPEMPIVKENHEEIISSESTETTTEIPLDESQQQLPKPLERPEDVVEVTTSTPKVVEPAPSIPDKNIFNVPAEELPPSETELPVTQYVEAPATSTESFEPTTSSSTHTTTTGSTTTTTPAPPTPAPTQQQRNEEDSNSWNNIDMLLTSTPPSTVPGGGGGGTLGGLPQTNGAAANLNQKLSNGPQSESVFIRLSNRIKALERNMSLSGQYLEELSRRYKKQVEELQQTLTQQTLTVRTLEEQNRRHYELEQLYAQRNSQLKHELDDLTLQVHACIVVIIFVGAFVFLVLMVGILFYRSLRRDTKEVLSLYGKGVKRKNDATNNSSNAQRKLNRRKSFEDFSDHQQRRESDVNNSCTSEKMRRPSEEAMLILKECKCENRLVVAGQVKPGSDAEVIDSHMNNANVAGRQRKISICYGSNNNINSTTAPATALQTQKSGVGRRKGEKYSWPNTAHAQQQALQHLEELNNADILEDSPEIFAAKSKKPPFVNGSQSSNINKSKKKKDFLRRQESSPPEIGSMLNNTSPAILSSAASDYDETLVLDEDDLDNFIPNADLAYNEFMPGGPRGYQCVAPPANANNNPASKTPKQLSSSSKSTDGNGKKTRRLSSPVFFKSPFTKSLKGKMTSSKSNPPHESTSWEWYRLRKSSSANNGSQNAATSSTNAYLRVSPNASLDSSSLSEINFPTNSTENSFRILEEAILSSGESAITSTTTTGSSSTNGNNRSATSNNKSGANAAESASGGNMMLMSSGISSSSNSNRSSSSNSSTTQSKKKNRSFNKIFRKVF